MTVARTLYANIDGVTGLEAVDISQSHEGATSIATITCGGFSGNLGDSISINIGYDTSHGKVFEGYVKRVERSYPSGLYSISANDTMTRAIDYFIVSSDPEHGYTYRNIDCEDLIREVMEMAGLNSFDLDNTYFTFGINNDVEVNLVSSYDYSRMLADLIAWMIWADKNGTIHLANRKPYPMLVGSPDESQPGFNADSSSGTITDDDIMSISIAKNDRDLRNKIVIYGAENLYAVSQQSTSYDPIDDDYIQILPSGFYKAAVLASPLIDSQSFANDACDYNLALYNRVTYEIIASVEGKHTYEARNCITLDSTAYSTYNGLWYIYQADHSLSKGGYVTNLTLRR